MNVNIEISKFDNLIYNNDLFIKINASAITIDLQIKISRKYPKWII